MRRQGASSLDFSLKCGKAILHLKKRANFFAGWPFDPQLRNCCLSLFNLAGKLRKRSVVLKLVKRAFDHVLGVSALHPHEIEQHAVTQVKR